MALKKQPSSPHTTNPLQNLLTKAGPVLIGGLLFSLALWLRSTNLTHFVTADEHNWIYRSGIFLHAFLQKDWPGTSVWLTPGVTTTWLGAIGLAIFYRIHQAAINQPFLEWLVSFPRNKIDLDVLLALRWSMALFTSLMVVAVYALACKLWSRPIALLGALLLLAEPHLLAVSRIIGHDALITFFVTASLLSFFYAKRLLPQIETQARRGVIQKIGQYRKNRSEWKSVELYPPPTPPLQGGRAKNFPPREGGLRGVFCRLAPYRWFILSGIFAGLAILSKAPAMILIPFVVLIAAVDIWQNRGGFKYWVWALLIWVGALWAAFILVWPAAWVAPRGQTWAVINNAFLSSAGLEDADIQPYWSIPDLGSFYYLINGAFKMSLFLMSGTVLALFGGWHKLRHQKLSTRSLAKIELLLLLLFAVLFGLMMTFGVKKSPRYILPAFPALVFVAAWGWLYALQRFRNPAIIVILSGLAILLTLNYAPYYFTYFNPLLGGAFTAPQVVRIGWGEGLDELGRWLDARPDAAAEHVGARYTATLYPFYQGAISSPISDELDYVAFYIKQTQSGYPTPEILAYFENQKPLYRVVLNGIEYAQVYKGPAMIPVQTGSRPDLPIAYRPHTIYAPIGGRLTIDLLWAAGSAAGPTGDSVILAIKSAGSSPAFELESHATITERTAGVRVSTHTFELPVDMARDAYILVVDNKPLGEIKARLTDIPADFEPLSAVMAGQLKLAGFRQNVDSNHLLVDLAWQGWPKATNDYTVFVQLLDDNEQRITGVDVAPDRGFTALDRKEIMISHYDVPLPDDLQPGPYKLLVGLYYFAGDELINVGAAAVGEQIIFE